MTTEYEFMEVEVSFRIFGEDLDPDAVTNVLGIRPDSAVRKGEERDLKVGSRVIHLRPARQGMWSISSKLPPDNPLEEHLQGLLALLEPKAEVIRGLAESGCSVDFFCGLFLRDYNDGVTLPPELLSGIAALGAELGLDIYDATCPDGTCQSDVE